MNRNEVLRQAQERAPGKLLYLAAHGSRLFGTHGPASDHDFRGMYRPDLKSALAGRVKDTLSFEVDEAEVVLWSFQQWSEMLAGGDTNAIDVYFAFTHPEGVVLETAELRRFRETCPIAQIVPRSLKGMRGFARGQAIKYGAKGHHYHIAKTVLEGANRYASATEEVKVREFWTEFGVTPEAKGLLASFPDRLGLSKAPDGFDVLMVLDKLFHLEAPLSLMQGSLEGVVAAYGQRAIVAGLQGADWKALSHSLRVLDEVVDLHATGELRFPLANAELYRRVKQGELEYPVVLGMIEEREVLASEAERRSVLLEKPNRELLEQALLEVYGLSEQDLELA